MHFVRSNVAPGSTVYTDGAASSGGRLPSRYDYDCVNHSRSEYARCETHTNSI